ncbi:hypothetical protein ALI144C_48600 [Actinosynnema sp. ALI-1.44]|uniref:NACHT domain-containing protein n=1 Tax=Actinosynnema sp. ALI-1.44 TaxID=1933779 RepID=UPI00097C023B|nr:NACHT domain-containing protein [Actinosynnema sp. ALI-1.44]ONI70509.1 hypothetical protein ALI144C_48600 [Actinosynnema sp. ALI-1.44]
MCVFGQRDQALARSRTPFLVRLRSYPDGALPQPQDMLATNARPIAGQAPDGWANRVFDSGRALLLVDGVDELRAERRPKVSKWLTDLLTAYPQTHIVVTSRPGAADADWLRGFRSLVLEPMTPSDVTEFCRRWHSAIRQTDHPADLDDYETALARNLESRRHLRTLASSPLLCALLWGTRKAEFLRDLVSIELLHLIDCGKIESLAALTAAKRLRELGIHGCFRMPRLPELNSLTTLDLGQLSYLTAAHLDPVLGQLDSLRMVHCPSVRDLSPLAGSPISRLHLVHCSVTELTALRAMPALRELRFLSEVPVDFRPLAGLPTPLTIWTSPAQAEQLPPLGPNVTVKILR